MGGGEAKPARWQQEHPEWKAAADEQYVVDDVDTLKAVADPLRLRVLLQTQDGPITVKEIATALGVPQTRLYYHVKLLCKHGLVRVAGRRMVSGIEERSYMATAKNWTVSPRLASVIAETGLLGALMDVVAAELAVALADDTKEIGDPTGAVPALTYTRWHLTPDDVEDVQDRLFAVMMEYGDSQPGPGTQEYNGFLGVFRRGNPSAADAGPE